MYVHIFAYRKIKYKDDGRDYVSLKEFLAIHMTFSVLHAWCTYFMVFNFFQSLSLILEQETNKHLLEMLSIEVMVIIALTLMLIEMCIYLAYYKDIIFSLVTLINYVGMLTYHMSNQEYDESIQTALITNICITGIFIILTLIHDLDRAFYLKYKRFYTKYE